MIRQTRIGVKVEETSAAVTGLAGVPVLVNLAHTMGLSKDVDTLLPPKERERGYSPSAAVKLPTHCTWPRKAAKFSWLLLPLSNTSTRS